ncbi:MAG TPA: rod shape-determining protein MreC, partial [Rhizomicrobium sp.]|nr:rod shape-determining protein MreC [Rhizomicrobium sp.]
MANGAWKIARRGNTQLPLVIVLALAVALVLLGRAQANLFDRARTAIIDRLEPMLVVVHAPVVQFDRWIGSINELFEVYRENLTLKDENARLKQWRNVAVVMQDRVKRYQALLHAVPDPDIHSVLSQVIGRANRPFLQTMILNAGAAGNVKPGEAVVDARGMIGRIYLTGQHTSWVILLTDLNSRIPVTVAPGNHPAMMVGDNTAMPTLDTMSQTVTLHAGDQVISSGDGGLLPPGLPIGTVVAQNGQYRVALLADAASAQDVEILAFSKPPETLPTDAQGQLPAIAAGLKPAAPPLPAPASMTPAPPVVAAAKPVPKTTKPATAAASPPVTPTAPQAAPPATAETP